MPSVIDDLDNPHERGSIFVSYSRHEASTVKMLVGLIRGANAPVFFDNDSIPPGSKWEEAIHSAIEKCRQMMVFWCIHSSKSKWVSKEISIAEKMDKPIIPVLLDKTSLKKHLRKYQYIDLSEGVRHAPDISGSMLSTVGAYCIGQSREQHISGVPEWLSVETSQPEPATISNIDHRIIWLSNSVNSICDYLKKNYDYY